jgi:hypothetical protein
MALASSEAGYFRSCRCAQEMSVARARWAERWPAARHGR